MTGEPDRFDVDKWVGLYEGGMTYQQIADQDGVSAMTVWSRLRRRGIGRARGASLHEHFLRRHAAVTPPILDRYREGESILSLSKTFSLTRPTITRIIEYAGETVRGAGAANRIRFRDPGERGRVTRQAHLGMGEGERQLEQLLADRGLPCERQVIVENYNLDLAVGDLAVEVHRARVNPLAPSGRELDRCKALIRLGYHVIYVWTADKPILGEAADEVVAFYEETRGDPAAPRQYRVIRSDGHFTSGGRGEPEKLSVKASPHRTRKAP